MNNSIFRRSFPDAPGDTDDFCPDSLESDFRKNIELEKDYRFKEVFHGGVIGRPTIIKS